MNVLFANLPIHQGVCPPKMGTEVVQESRLTRVSGAESHASQLVMKEPTEPLHKVAVQL